MGKSLKKALVKFDFGHQIAKSMGLPDPAGDLLYGDQKALTPAEQAAKSAKAQLDQDAEVTRQQGILAANATSLAANSAADNTASVIAGGSASEADTSGTDLKRKRVSSLSSTLGV